jgi:SnoaL-like domain
MGGDDAGFVACFHPSVEVYSEPELSSRPVLESREDVTQWLERARNRWAKVSVDLDNVVEHENGAVTEAILVGRDQFQVAWRLAVAICVEDELIIKARVFRDIEAATKWLADMG